MANAHPEVFAAAGGVAPSNDDDGWPPSWKPCGLPEGHPSASPRRPAVLAITTHQRRLAAANAIRDRHPELDAEVVVDPDPAGAPQSDAHRQSGLAYGTRGIQPRIVLQDDVTLCPGFLDAVHDIVAVVPSSAVSLFADGVQSCVVTQAGGLLGYSFAAVTNNYVPTQALIVPTGVARSFDDLCRRARAGMHSGRSGHGPLSGAVGCGYAFERSQPGGATARHQPGRQRFHGTASATCYADSGLHGHRWDKRVFWPQKCRFLRSDERALC